MNTAEKVRRIIEAKFSYGLLHMDAPLLATCKHLQPCVGTGYSQEDLAGTINNRDGWQDRQTWQTQRDREREDYVLSEKKFQGIITDSLILHLQSTLTKEIIIYLSACKCIVYVRQYLNLPKQRKGYLGAWNISSSTIIYMHSINHENVLLVSTADYYFF